MKPIALALMPLLLTLSACKMSKKEEEAKPPVPPVLTGPQDKVTGLNVEGRWSSQCLQDLAGIPSRKITMEYKKTKEMTRTVSTFFDRYCAQQNTVQTNTGKFGYSEQLAGGVFTLEYWFDTGNGTFGITGDNVRRDGTILYIADLQVGTAVPQIPLILEGGPNDVVQVPNHSPKKGDTVVYTAGGFDKTWVNQGDDNQDGIFQIAYTYQTATGPNSGVEDATASNLWATAEFTILMRDCTPPNGVSEIVTVPAGKFQTCRVIENDGYVWYGNLPILGVVKEQKFDGTGLMELKSFALGN